MLFGKGKRFAFPYRPDRFDRDNFEPDAPALLGVCLEGGGPLILE
jgi:hypothetical protein